MLNEKLSSKYKFKLVIKTSVNINCFEKGNEVDYLCNISRFNNCFASLF